MQKDFLITRMGGCVLAHVNDIWPICEDNLVLASIVTKVNSNLLEGTILLLTMGSLVFDGRVAL